MSDPVDDGFPALYDTDNPNVENAKRHILFVSEQNVPQTVKEVRFCHCEALQGPWQSRRIVLIFK